MKKKVLSMTLAVVLSLSMGITAFAAPKKMQNGEAFDAEYYAEANPDVKAALGTDEQALYNHYVNYGKAEGRRACAPPVNDPVSGATIVNSYYDSVFRCQVDKYSNGITVLHLIKHGEQVEEQYRLQRTDYSDGLLDEDGNGIDDRDPLNSCGYTDLNYNGVIDGAPSLPFFVDEPNIPGYTLCEHGVIQGLYYCSNPKCVARQEQSKNVIAH
jgi:hypothetical protein